MKTSVSGPGRIRQLNRTAVLAHIRHDGKNSRLQIGKELGLSAAAITSVVSELLEEGLLKKSAQATDSSSKAQGRPISILELNPDKACVFGINLRPSANKCIIESAWADYTGKVHTIENLIEVDTKHYQSIIDGIKTAVLEIKENIRANVTVHGISIGVPGVVENQTIRIAPKLTCIEDPKFINTLATIFDFPISYENDVNLGAMSELQNQPRLRDISFAYLHVYSGVGSSIVLEGKLLKGRRGWAGEIGHLKFPATSEGQTSFEHLLSMDGILGDLLEELGHQGNDFGALVDYIDKDDKRVMPTINNYCNDLFNAINVLHSVIDLDEVMLDLQSALLLNRLLPRIRERVKTLQHPYVISSPSIEQQANLHGAALNALNLALENIEKRIPKKKS